MTRSRRAEPLERKRLVRKQNKTKKKETNQHSNQVTINHNPTNLLVFDFPWFELVPTNEAQEKLKEIIPFEGLVLPGNGGFLMVF